MANLDKCINCNREEMLGARRLCGACYDYHHNHHSLDQFPRSTWRNEDLMAELDFFQRSGLSVPEAAERIGVSLSALRKAIERSRTRANTTVGPRFVKPQDQLTEFVK